MRRFDVHRWAAAAMVLAFVAGACSGPDSDRGVQVRGVATDVGLGVDPQLEEDVVNPNAPRLATPQTGVTLAAPDIDTSFGGTIQPPLPRVQDTACPDPGLNDFPRYPAPSEINAEMEIEHGSDYLWQYQAGEQVSSDRDVILHDNERFEFEQIGPPGTNTLLFTQHTETDTTATGGGAYGPGSYEYSWSFLVFDQLALRRSFLVIEKSRVTFGDTERDETEGLYFVRSEIALAGEDGEFPVNEDDEIVWQTVFEPTAPILMLSSPVESGAVIDSTGLDPERQIRMTIRGVVVGNKQLDSCANAESEPRVDTWFVDGKEFFTRRVMTEDGSERIKTTETDYDYAVATHYGGLLAQEIRGVNREDVPEEFQDQIPAGGYYQVMTIGDPEPGFFRVDPNIFGTPDEG